MDEKRGSGRNTEQILMEAVATMRRNPEKYQELHRALRGAKTDEERVRQLMNFSTSERDLATLMPSGTSEAETAAAITTVTVTTVFIIVDSAY